MIFEQLGKAIFAIANGTQLESICLYSIKNSTDVNDVNIEMVTQFLQPDANLKENLQQLVGQDFGQLQIDETLEKCPKVSTLNIPQDIISASNLEQDQDFEIGQTFHLKCPQGLKLSFDNDTIDHWDDLFSVTCLPILRYSNEIYWPTCVKDCKVCLPPAPVNSGLIPIVPPNSIAIGDFAQYQCLDSSLGVNEADTEFLNVKCVDEDEFDLPVKWPICMPRTTTVSPVIAAAFNATLFRRVLEVQEGIEKDNEFVDLSVELDAGDNYFQTVTLPSLLALMVLLALVMILSHVKSPICNICAEENYRREKTIIPIKEPHGLQKEDLDLPKH